MNSRDMNNVVTSSGAPLPVGVHYPEAPHQQQQHGGHHSHGGSKHTTASGNTTALTPTSSTNSRGDMSVAPGVRKQFLRTKLCKHFLRGCCLYGDKCTYAHDYSQIQVRPDLRKTRMCQANLEGRCPYRAEDCQFAHSTEDLKATPGLFKTVLCSWWQKGKCDMGDKCRFAHGEEELQRPNFRGNSEENSRAPSGPENISITPGSTPLQSPSLVEEKEVSSRSATPPGLDNVTPVSVMQRPRTSDTNNRSVPQGLQRNVFTPPPEIAISPAEVLKYQQNQFASVLSGSLAAAAQAAAMQQRPTQDPTAYAAQQQQQWAIAAAAATAATAAVASIAGAFEPTPAQLQNLSLIAARSLHQQAAMQQMYISYSAQQQQAMLVQQQAAAALAAQQWQRQQMMPQIQRQQQQENISSEDQQRYDQQQRGKGLQDQQHASASAVDIHDSEALESSTRTGSDRQVNLHAPVKIPEADTYSIKDYPSSSSLSDMATGTTTTESRDVAAPLPNIKSSAAILSGAGLKHVSSMSIPEHAHLSDDDIANTSSLMKAFASSPALCTVGSLLGLSNQAEPLSAEEEAEYAEFGDLAELYSEDPSVQATTAFPNYDTASSHHSIGGLAQSASFNCLPSLLASVGESPRPRAGSDPAMHDPEISDALFAELQNLVSSQDRSVNDDVH